MKYFNNNSKIYYIGIFIIAMFFLFGLIVIEFADLIDPTKKALNIISVIFNLILVHTYIKHIYPYIFKRINNKK